MSIKNNMITFQAHHGNKLISRLIRIFSPKYNHISIRVNDYVYEAHIEHGVTKTLYSKWDKRSVVDKIKIKTKREKQVVAFLEKQVGKKYDVFGILSFIWVFFKPRKGYWYCSELAQVALYKAIGLKSTHDDYDQKVSPFMFWRNLESMVLLINNLLK